ncbi:MAG: Cu-processing system ATP-binding protein [Natronomonas sp.]|jgi:Cu-processing system ATP-binding protein
MNVNATDVSKSYGPVTALDELSLEIPSGTTFGVLGTNGAGKTTLFTLLVGLDRPDAGELTVGCQSVIAAGRAIRTEVGYLPESVGFPDDLTGREILSFHARMRGLGGDRGKRIESVLDTVGLSNAAADRRVEGYSNGMRRRLGLGTALLPRPAVLVLDEPTAGLDPRGVAEFHRIVERVRETTDATVILSSHVLSEVEGMCDRVAILHDGQVAAAGSVEELTGEGTVRLKLTPGAETAVADLHDAVVAFDPASIAGDTGAEPITVDCPARGLPELFAAIEAASGVTISDVRVVRGGLEGSFHEAIPGEVDA